MTEPEFEIFSHDLTTDCQARLAKFLGCPLSDTNFDVMPLALVPKPEPDDTWVHKD